MAPRSVALLFLLPGIAAALTPDAYVSYSGVARARGANQFLYGERHVLRYQAGRIAERVVLYTCRDGTPFARKTVSYVDPIAPDFTLEDAENGLREGIKSDAGARSVFFRSGAEAGEKVGPLPRADALVADAGFDEFVRTNWERLMSGRALPMHFLLPSRLQSYDFQAEHLRSQVFEGTPTEVFRLRLGGFFGWLLPGIDVYYSAADHQLVHYDGLSDLRDSSGDNVAAQITFHPADRQATIEQQMLEAENTPLHQCRRR